MLRQRELAHRQTSLLHAAIVVCLLIAFTGFYQGIVGTMLLESEASADGAAGRLLFNGRVLSFIAIASVLGVNWRASGAELERFALVIMFPLYCLLTSQWSIDKALTIKSGVLLCAPTLVGFLLGAQMGRLFSVRFVQYFLVAVVLVSAGLAIAVPDVGRHTHRGVLFNAHTGDWKGVYYQKNLLGGVAGLVVLCFAVMRAGGRHPRMQRVIAIVLSVCVMLLSRSATATIAVIVTLALYYLCKWVMAFGRFGRVAIGAGLGVAAFAALVLLNAMPSAWISISQKTATVSGRTVIWSEALQQFRSAPLFSVGYGTVGPHILSPKMLVDISKAAVDVHSGYLWILTESGAVGFLLFVVVIMCSVRRCIRMARGAEPALVEMYWFMGCLYVYAGLVAITETNAFSPIGTIGFFVYLLTGALWGGGGAGSAGVQGAGSFRRFIRYRSDRQVEPAGTGGAT
jgi:O-antigen ligase